MSIRVQCNHCGENYQVPDEWAGKQAKCKGCGHRLDIPNKPAPAPAPAAKPEPEALDDPFAGLPAEEAMGSGPLQPVRSKARRPSGQPAVGGPFLSFVMRRKVVVAVVVGMCWVFLCFLYDLVFYGPRAIEIVHGILLTVGLMVVGGSLLVKPKRRKPSNDKRWAVRMVIGIAVGIGGIICSFGVVFVLGRTGIVTNPVVLANLLMPFLAVFALVAVVAGLALVYFLLVLIFPKSHFFQIAGCGYVGVTVLIPLAGLVLGLMLQAASSTLERRTMLSSATESRDVPETVDPEIEISPRRPVGPSPAAPKPLRERPTPSPPGRPDDFGSRPNVPAAPSTPPGFGSRPNVPAAPSTPPGFGSRSPRTPGSGFRGPAGPRGGMGGPRGFASVGERFKQQYGADKVVTVTVTNIPPGATSQVLAKIRAASGASAHSSRSSGSNMTVALAPVEDVQGFIAKLDLGRVLSTGADGRTIEIVCDGR